MTELRALVVAYNDFPIAAADDAYQIGQYRLSRSKDALSLDIQFVVIGSSATDLATKESALSALRAVNATLVVQQARELELNDLISAGATTLTSVTGGFLAAHVGDWIVIRTIGSRRITAVGSTNSITVSSAVAAGTYRAIKPARLFHGTHADRTLISSNGTYDKISGSDLNTEYSRHYNLSVAGQLPYSDVNGLVRLTVQISWDTSRRRTFTISGSYATTSAGNAYALYAAGISALITLHAAAFGGLSTYRLVNQTEGYSADDLTTVASTAKTYDFSYTYQELSGSDSGTIDESISISIGQGGSTSHGLKMRGGVFATVSYRGSFVAGTNLRTKYESTIRNRISTAITAYSGDGRGQQAIEREDATFEKVNNTINASWTVLLLGRSGTILEYTPSTTIGNDPNVFSPALWDGKPHTYAIWQNKPNRVRSNTVTVRSLAPFGFESTGLWSDGVKNPFRLPVGGKGGVFADNGMTPGDGVVAIKWPQSAGGGGIPGGGGIWLQRGAESVTSSVEYIGETSHGAFAIATIYKATFSRNDVWVEDAEPFKPRFETPPPLTGI